MFIVAQCKKISSSVGAKRSSLNPMTVITRFVDAYFLDIIGGHVNATSADMHEAGFGRFNPDTFSLSPNAIPTLKVVDDTFVKHREVMTAIIGKAKERAGIS